MKKITPRMVLILLVLGIVTVMCIQSYQKFQQSQTIERKDSQLQEEISSSSDSSVGYATESEEGPQITLKESSISISKGDKINYSSYILKAVDPQDGDLYDSVTWKTISETELQAIVQYIVEDSDGHTASTELLISYS
ncbi:hypothetical protein, partial [Faecalicoccus pleomorphus]|uniref:hypothetical protein n=1 Tax=Faecalicoccus pleomorphus TaxID=1323 RepID=UPI00294288B3